METHWKRGRRSRHHHLSLEEKEEDHDDPGTTTTGTSIVLVRGSPEIAVFRLGLKDPFSILYKLGTAKEEDDENLMVERILSFTDYTILSCDCCIDCIDRPVVFCCRRGRPIGRETPGKSLKDFDDGDEPLSYYERFVLKWQTNPNAKFLEGATSVIYKTDNNIPIVCKNNTTMIPQDVEWEQQRQTNDRHSSSGLSGGFLIVVDENGLHGDLEIPWNLAHQHPRPYLSGSDLCFRESSFEYIEYEAEVIMQQETTTLTSNNNNNNSTNEADEKNPGGGGRATSSAQQQQKHQQMFVYQKRIVRHDSIVKYEMASGRAAKKILDMLRLHRRRLGEEEKQKQGRTTKKSLPKMKWNKLKPLFVSGQIPIEITKFQLPKECSLPKWWTDF